MTTWQFDRSKFKNYPHFDAPIAAKKVHLLVSDTERIASNAFYPFLRYYDEWQPYRTPDGQDKPEKKSRPISYCARRDAYIFMYYRHVISQKYEDRLKSLGISSAPIAYRKIPKGGATGPGKCNIDFAKDAFDYIKNTGDCVAVALDIKGYFDHLDHQRIRQIWADLLNVKTLPKDHAAVFKAITNYSYVEVLDAYKRLGYFGPKKSSGSGTIDGYLQLRSDIPKQLCSPSDFREKICGRGSGYSNLVQRHRKDYGIPQGSPISDLIANFYLLYFDVEMAKYAKTLGGTYLRYSDDILFLVPSGTGRAQQIQNYVAKEIRSHGRKLEIKSKKTSVVEFRRTGSRLIYAHQFGDQGANGFEYLGFRFDGSEVFIKDTTISRYYRKISLATRAEAKYLVDKYPGLDSEALMRKFNHTLFLQRWGRVKEFKAVKNDFRKWTFRTYVERCASTFGNSDTFFHQIKNTKKLVRSRLKTRLQKILNET